MLPPYSVAAHWAGDYDEIGLREWVVTLRRSLGAAPTLGLVFMAPRFFPHAATILEILRVHGQIPLLAGCSSTSLVCNSQEIEENGGLVLALFNLPGAQLRGVRFEPPDGGDPEENIPWPLRTGVTREATNGWLVFADPFNMDSEAWLAGWNNAYAPLPTVGGLASGDFTSQSTQVYLDGEVFTTGGVAVSIGGDVALASVISQGCTPIGQTWTLTKVQENLIHSIGNRPAYEVLVETFNSLPPEEQRKAQRNLFIGLVTDEYREEFHRGDFLVRNLIGADPRTGIIAVGALPRVGQTVQFQRRDADAAREDMAELLQRTRNQLRGRTVFGGCLCCCNGRGERLFGEPSHDARRAQETFGPLGLAGFFCNGEIGPVGPRNFLHGYTASLALFVSRR